MNVLKFIIIFVIYNGSSKKLLIISSFIIKLELHINNITSSYRSCSPISFLVESLQSILRILFNSSIEIFKWLAIRAFCKWIQI